MSLDRDAILLDNLRASLDLYQRSLVWAMTAAAAFFVLTLSLGDLIAFAIELQREAASSAPRSAAWWLGLLMFVVLVAAPYAAIAGRVWYRLGSRPRKALRS